MIHIKYDKLKIMLMLDNSFWLHIVSRSLFLNACVIAICEFITTTQFLCLDSLFNE